MSFNVQPNLGNDDKVSVWHLHGEAMKPSTMLLGYEHYASYLNVHSLLSRGVPSTIARTHAHAHAHAPPHTHTHTHTHTHNTNDVRYCRRCAGMWWTVSPTSRCHH